MVPLGAKGETFLSSAIVGLDGGVWAQSADFKGITPEEVNACISAITTPPGTFKVAGVKYMQVAGDENLIRGRAGKENIIVRKTNQTLVIALFIDPDVPSGKASSVVMSLAEYLENSDY